MKLYKRTGNTDYHFARRRKNMFTYISLNIRLENCPDKNCSH
jgi:hypothetical protein